MYSVASIVFWAQNTARQGKSPLQPQIKNGKSDTNVYRKMYRNVTEKGDDKMKYILPNGEIIEASDELAKLLAEIKELLANMTKEERITWFEHSMFSKPLRYEHESEGTSFIVRTHFDKSANESIAEKAERVAAKMG